MSLAVRSSPSPKISFAKDMDRTSNPPTEPLQTLQDQPTGSAQISGHHTPNTSRPESRSSPFSAIDAPTQLNIKFLEANSEQKDVTDLHDASASGNAPESPLSTIAVIVPQKRPLEDENCDDRTLGPKRPVTKGRAKSTKAPTPPTPSSRPTRNRKAPERLIETRQSKPAITTPARKTPTSRVFSPTYITTVSSSRLGKADVYHMLLEPLAWTSLTAEQQTTLISMLPKNSANQALIEKIKAGETEDTRPSAFTMSTDCFRTDVAKFKADLKNGHLAKGWRTVAEQAVIDRAEGAFDEWKDEEAELWWGQKGN